MSYYMSDIPGRLRIESPALRSGSPSFDSFRAFIAGIEGIYSVKIRPEIGSALILYDPAKLDHGKLLEALDKSGYFDHSKAKTLDDYLEEGIEEAWAAAAELIEDVV